MDVVQECGPGEAADGLLAGGVEVIDGALAVDPGQGAGRRVGGGAAVEVGEVVGERGGRPAVGVEEGIDQGRVGCRSRGRAWRGRP